MYDLRALAVQRGFEIVQEYTDRISGAKARRPGLDQLLADARRGKFQIVLCWAFDRIARSTRHFLEVLDELNHEKRVRAGMRRARLEGQQIGRAPLQVDRVALLRDRQNGETLGDLAAAYHISKASVRRVIKDAKEAVSKGFPPAPSPAVDSKELRPPKSVA
jgi:DNA invertase Pin-like site-specific DNA recombinase